jgi:uncharacterized protein
MSIINSLYKNNKLHLSKEYLTDIVYEGMTGSTAYGVSSNSSDVDVYGICMLPLHMAFPHRSGWIRGFGPAPDFFESMNQHHIQHNEKEYDVAILSIVKFFDLAAQNNPNIIDVLFLPRRCITHMDQVGEHMRSNRQLFLHKGCMQKFLGYAHSQLKKMETKTPIGKRKELVEQYGVDVKFMYHLFRLCLECEQILTEYDLDLERNSEILKSVRNGMYSIEEMKAWFKEKELHLQKLYVDSKIPYSPNWDVLRTLLIQCFEIRYGSINEASNDILLYKEKLKQIRKLTEF